LAIYTKTCGCGKTYQAAARKVRPRKTCGRTACQRRRRRETSRRWRERNPAYWSSSEGRSKAKQWRESHGSYWRSWREEHEAYVERNREQSRERMRRRRALFAKQSTAWKDPVGYVKGLHQGALFAKQTTATVCLDGTLTVLEMPGMFAKQASVDAAVPAPK
jgi:hypothetical protein